MTLLQVPLAGYVAWMKRLRTGGAQYSLIDERPLVSVIVPGQNQAGIIAECVESILGSRYLRMDVILVDGGSVDSTARVMEDLAQQHDRVRFLSGTKTGQGEALACGIAAAAGDILMVVHAETRCAPETLLLMLEGFNHPKVGAVWRGNLSTGLITGARSFLKGALPPGSIGAFRNEVVSDVGVFRDGVPGGGPGLLRRVHKAGYRVRVSRWLWLVK